MKKRTINDSDREDFVRNEEGLYNWWRREMRGEHKLRAFVRANRAAIDAVIEEANNPKPKRLGSYYMIGCAVGPMTSPRS